MSSPLDSRSLSLLGGSPAFAEPLHIGRPNLGDRGRFEARIEAIWQRRWLTNDGPLVREFEQRIASRIGVRHCIAVCNATIGLEIAIRALGLTGEVIVPAFTFVASAHAVRWQGLRPVFCDIDPVTHQLDPAAVAMAITPRTSGIMGVHLWGQSCPVAPLQELADRHGLKLLFDAAHAFGSEHQGRPIGGFGAAEVFSFHGTKFVNSGEGGAVTTNDDALAETMRLMRNFGFRGYDRVVHPGTNGKMSELHAAMGLTSLESMQEFAGRNRENTAQYVSDLSGLPGIALLPRTSDVSNEQYVVLEVDAERAGVTRDELLTVLHSENILARRYFYPGCHRMEPYASEPESTPHPVPQTERVADRILQLPTGTQVSLEMVRSVSQVIRTALAEHERVRPVAREFGRTLSTVWQYEPQQ